MQHLLYAHLQLKKMMTNLRMFLRITKKLR